MSWQHRTHLLKRGDTLVRCSLDGARRTTSRRDRVTCGRCLRCIRAAKSSRKGVKRTDGPHPSQAWFNGTLKARKARGVPTKEIAAFKKAMLARHSHLRAPKPSDRP